MGAAGVSMATIMERLGRSQSRTAERYVHATTQESLAAARALGKVGRRR
jgi:hypothetical protein